MTIVDLSPLQKYINLGTSLPGEIGSFFASAGPTVIGVVLVALVIHVLTKIPPFSHIIQGIMKDAKKSRAEPAALKALAKPGTRVKIYYAMLLSFWFSCVVYLLIFLGCFASAVGVWFLQVEPGINRFGVFAGSSVVGVVSLFFMWAQAGHANQVGNLILRLRNGA